MIKSKHLAKAIFKMINSGKDPEVLATKVSSFLKKNNISLQLPNIIHHLDQLEKERDRENSLRIDTPERLSGGSIESIRNLAKVEKEIKVASKENKELMGGFVARHKGYIYDGSVRSQINKLRKVLRSEI